MPIQENKNKTNFVWGPVTTLLFCENKNKLAAFHKFFPIRALCFQRIKRSSNYRAIKSLSQLENVQPQIDQHEDRACGGQFNQST